MKRIFRTALIAAAAIIGSVSASAQYSTIANQITGILGPALTGGFNYKGYVEASYMAGIGQNNGDFLGVSTSQGWKYGQRFFMGLGIGVDALFAHVDNSDWKPGPIETPDKGVTRTGCVIPVFTDFRGIFGPLNGISCQIGLKMGCSFLVSSNYIEVNRGYITSNQCFYLKPSVGVRIPVKKGNSRQAVNVSVAYQLITPDYRQYYNGTNKAITLNSLGVMVGFEW